MFAAARKGGGTSITTWLIRSKAKRQEKAPHKIASLEKGIGTYMTPVAGRPFSRAQTNTSAGTSTRETRHGSWRKKRRKRLEDAASQHTRLDEGRGAEPPDQGRGSWTVGTPESSLNRGGPRRTGAGMTIGASCAATSPGGLRIERLRPASHEERRGLTTTRRRAARAFDKESCEWNRRRGASQ